jgi:hypothetical protein
MVAKLEKLKKQSMDLYFKYKQGLLSYQDYINMICVLDQKIDEFELSYGCDFNHRNFLEKSSSKHPH